MYTLEEMVYLIDENGLFSLNVQTGFLEALHKNHLSANKDDSIFESVFVDPTDRSVLLTSRYCIYRYKHNTRSKAKELHEAGKLCGMGELQVIFDNRGVDVANKLAEYSRIMQVSACGNELELVSRKEERIQRLNLSSKTIQTMSDPFVISPLMSISIPSVECPTRLVTSKTGLWRLNIQKNSFQLNVKICFNVRFKQFNNTSFKGIVSTPSGWYIVSVTQCTTNFYIFAFHANSKQMVLLLDSNDLQGSKPKHIEHMLYLSPSSLGGSPKLLIPGYNTNSLYIFTLAPFFDVSLPQP